MQSHTSHNDLYCLIHSLSLHHLTTICPCPVPVCLRIVHVLVCIVVFLAVEEEERVFIASKIAPHIAEIERVRLAIIATDQETVKQQQNLIDAEG